MYILTFPPLTVWEIIFAIKSVVRPERHLCRYGNMRVHVWYYGSWAMEAMPQRNEERRSWYADGFTVSAIRKQPLSTGKGPAFSFLGNLPLVLDMTEMFSTLFGQNDPQGPPGSSSLGFGPGKPAPPLPQNQVSLAGQMPPQLGDEGPALRKPGAMNEPFYLLRELPGRLVVHHTGNQGLAVETLLRQANVAGVCKQR